MSIPFYILLLSNVFIFILNTFFGSIIDQNELLISVLLIAFIGIPHGAVDHILFLKNTNKSKLFFYFFYLLLILIYVISWIFIPLLSLSFFLLLSAYHFGQSQLQQYPNLQKSSRVLMAFLWGTTVLSGFVLINFDQIFNLMLNQSDFNAFVVLFNYTSFKFICIISALLLSVLTVINYKNINIIKESLYLVLILITFSMQSAFIGFSLFFVFNHSLEVLRSEHSFLSRIRTNFNLLQFIKYLTPFTLLSLFGVVFFYFLSEFDFLELSLPLLILITISSLTLPHALVMEVFYRNQK